MDMTMASTTAIMTGMAGLTASSSGMMPTSTAAGGMGDMGGMDMGGDNCKISMLWNWYTVDTCFIASSWHNRSTAAFAGSCIGVVLLVMVLEALRRTGKEFDAYLVRRHTAAVVTPVRNEAHGSDSDSNKNPVVAAASNLTGPRPIKPNVFEQLVRALLHMLQFAVAYFVMLLAMYYNGYVIICIFIGAFIGSFIFNWTSVGSTGESSEVTYCCG